MTAYLWLLKYIIPFIVGGILGGYGVGLVKNGTIDRQATEIKEQKEIVANQKKTIKTLNEWREKEAKSCEARINSKDTTIKRLKYIDSLKPSTGVMKDEKNNVATGSSDDAILDELNGMYTEGPGKDGVHQTDDPGIAGET